LETVTCRLQSHSSLVSSGDAVSCLGHNYYGQVMLLQCVILFERCMTWCVVMRGCIVWLTTFLYVQLGDGSTTQRVAPLAVAGLSSGVAVLALGGVRLFVAAV
jgi:hypothetical protein